MENDGENHKSVCESEKKQFREGIEILKGGLETVAKC